MFRKRLELENTISDLKTENVAVASKMRATQSQLKKKTSALSKENVDLRRQLEEQTVGKKAARTKLDGARARLSIDLEIFQSLKRWNDVLAISETLWKASDRRLDVVLAAYAAASALKLQPKAEIWVERGMKACPPDWRICRYKGDILLAHSDMRGAEEMYQRAVEISPHEPYAHAALGRYYLNAGRPREAADHLAQALTLAGATAKDAWRVSLGRAQSKLGLFKDAKETFERVSDGGRTQNVEAMIAEMERRIVSGSSSMEASSDYYDEVFADHDEYRKTWRESVYQASWREIVEVLGSHKAGRILDLGCGPGQFADCVAELLPGTGYHGVDFSQVAIAKARERQPTLNFSVVELPVETYDFLGAHDAIVCTEVLEHIDRDVEVLEAIKGGVLAIFSVPNFDSFGHVRFFETREAVLERYGSLFVDLHVHAHELQPNRILWIGSGIRR